MPWYGSCSTPEFQTLVYAYVIAYGYTCKAEHGRHTLRGCSQCTNGMASRREKSVMHDLPPALC
jgi:hypothetical protein